MIFYKCFGSESIQNFEKTENIEKENWKSCISNSFDQPANTETEWLKKMKIKNISLLTK